MKTLEKAPPENPSGVFDSAWCVITDIYDYLLRSFFVIIYAYSYFFWYFFKNPNVIIVANSSENTTEYQTP